MTDSTKDAHAKALYETLSNSMSEEFVGQALLDALWAGMHQLEYSFTVLEDDDVDKVCLEVVQDYFDSLREFAWETGYHAGKNDDYDWDADFAAIKDSE